MLFDSLRKSKPFPKFIFSMFLLLTSFSTLMLISEVIASTVFNVSFFNIDITLLQPGSDELVVLNLGAKIREGTPEMVKNDPAVI